MFSNATTKNVTTGANEIPLHITVSVQTRIAYVNEEPGFDKNKRKDDA
jgi:hypothetical protein